MPASRPTGPLFWPRVALLSFVLLVSVVWSAWSAVPGRTTSQSQTRVLGSPLVPDLSIDDASVAEGDSGETQIVFHVRLSYPSLTAVMAFVRTIDSTGTATPEDGDYVPSSGLLTFEPGTMLDSLVVVVHGDTRIERDERFEVLVSDVTGANLARELATGTIVNDDWPVVSVDDASRAEGDSSTTVLWFTARLSEPGLEGVKVNVALSDSTATLADSDYAALTSVLTIPAGFTSGSIGVTIKGDTNVEPDEWFRVRITNAVAASLGDDLAVGGILNDDAPTISVSDTSMLEGDAGFSLARFRVRLSAPGLTPVSFHWSVLDLTARADDDDFLGTAGDTTFAVGQTQIEIPVAVLGDTLLEGNEVFTVQVSAAQGAKNTEAAGHGWIRNDEAPEFERYVPSVGVYHPGTLPPSFGDANQDGRVDMPLMINTGAGFVEMPGFRTILGTGNYHGSAWCDYDRDGDMDLVQLPYPIDPSSDNFTHLLENAPSGFKDVAPSLGMDIVGQGETPSWGDFNADGWPDLFLPFYSHIAPFRSYFFINLGNGQFAERGDSAGISLPNIPLNLRPEGTAVADWNGDGSLDLYCASHLFINDGLAHFHDVRAQVGLPIIFDEGANFVDYDNDGDLDLYLRTSRGPTLYRNDGGTFSDVTSVLGLPNIGWEWGDRWADIDGDGDLDFIYFPPGAVPRLMLNDGDEAFHEDLDFTGLLGNDLAAFADVDNDGDIDIAVGAYARQFALNHLDQIPRRRTYWLKVRVVDNDGMLTAQGATVRLRSLDDPSHPIQTRIVDGGSGYVGQDEYTITFGGVGSGAFDLEVSYPSLPGTPRVVGPAQNPLLAGIRPGESVPKLFIIRPNGAVTIQPLTDSFAGVADIPINGGILRPAVPNPARVMTRFSLSVPGAGPITLDIHDLEGRRVRRLTHDGHRSGESSVIWDLEDSAGKPVPAGLYFARLRRNGHVVSTQRVAVVR